MIKGICFDLDGTLVDSIPGIARGMAEACEKLDYDIVPEDAVRGMVGKGAWKLCERCFDYLGIQPTKEKLGILESVFVSKYTSSWKTGTLIYPGMKEILRKLNKKGIKLAVLTNKTHEITLELVEDLFRDVVTFDIIKGYSTGCKRKPDPEGLRQIMDFWDVNPDEIVLVGDSRTDAETAARVNVSCLLVNWGYEDDLAGSLEEWGALPVSSPEELYRKLMET